jgi:DNA helicase-2/ATP-dependent DNA helicase PcrA
MTQYRRAHGEYMTDPSRFVEDIPEDVLEPVQLVEEDSPEAVEAPDEPAQLTDREDATANQQLPPGDAPPPDSGPDEPSPTRPDRDPSEADGLPF